jgi:H+/Na+-translocating ferredoxin:NAD+ oxidoreductase subunit B
MKAFEKPARAVHSNNFVQVDEDNFVACGICAERCHMDAITVGDAVYVNPDRWLGCGVCVPECPSDAMMYKQKQSSDLYVPPKNLAETFMKLAE